MGTWVYSPQSLKVITENHGDVPLPRSNSTPRSNNVPMSRSTTRDTVPISMEMLEKLYLSPPNKVQGHLRETLANPTPLAVLGICVALTPISIALMGWHQAGNIGIATTGVTIWFGGLLLILAAVGEFILGETFAFCAFGVYGAYFLSFATTFIPWFNAFGSFAPDQTKPWEGVDQGPFLASFAFFFVVMDILSLIFLVCSFRTNVILVGLFVGYVFGFGFAASADFSNAAGNNTYGEKMLVAAGYGFFFSCILAWYLGLALMMESVDFPFSLPVGDLSQIFLGKKQRATAKGRQQD